MHSALVIKHHLQCPCTLAPTQQIAPVKCKTVTLAQFLHVKQQTMSQSTSISNV